MVDFLLMAQLEWSVLRLEMLMKLPGPHDQVAAPFPRCPESVGIPLQQQLYLWGVVVVALEVENHRLDEPSHR